MLSAGYQSQFCLWGSRGWLRFDLLPGRPLEWESDHPEAPRGIQRMTAPDKYYSNEYVPFVQAAIDAAAGTAAPPLTAQDGLAALRVIFGLYDSAASGRAVSLC